MKRKTLPHDVPQYHTEATDNGRYFISGISNERMDHDLEQYGELAVEDAQRPGRWFYIFRRGGQLIGDDDHATV